MTASLACPETPRKTALPRRAPQPSEASGQKVWAKGVPAPCRGFLARLHRPWGAAEAGEGSLGARRSLAQPLPRLRGREPPQLRRPLEGPKRARPAALPPRAPRRRGPDPPWGSGEPTPSHSSLGSFTFPATLLKEDPFRTPPGLRAAWAASPDATRGPGSPAPRPPPPGSSPSRALCRRRCRQGHAARGTPRRLHRA